MPIRRRNHMRGLHSAAAFTLLCALVAGLACDEKALTETREPVGPTDIGSGDEGDLVAQLDVSAMAIQLPVNQGVATTAPAPAFRVNQTGTGPNGIFQITRTSNTQAALQGLTNGRGLAGFFQNTNTTNNQPALKAQTNGSGVAVHGVATGTNSAGAFQIGNANNTQPALLATTNGNGPALDAENFRLGPAGFFQIILAANRQPALEARTQGSGGAIVGLSMGARGPAGTFKVVNSSSPGTALTAETIGTGHALVVKGRSTFNGNVTVNGTLTKPAGSFRIDHPLDQEHKYLSHSFVESPDMMNVYNGNVTLDASGRGTVVLPEYFEALNRDFRYQLTAIGAPGPNLYIAGGVQQNRFQIAGGRPYARVSWQVTGIRQDAYANEHRIKVEEDKPQGEKKPLQGDLVARR